ARSVTQMAIGEQQKTSLILTLFIGGVCLALIGYFHFMIGRGMIKDAETRKSTEKAKLDDLKKQLAEINALMNQADAMKEQAEVIEKTTRRLPASPDAPGFMKELVNVLGTTGIIQEEVKPELPISRPLYTEIPYSVKSHGHYHAFGQFMTLIEQNPDRFMRVRNFAISNNMERPSIHDIDMEITTFMFNK
ncbi:MAG: type 4a pilus biogenesis protein PilO, partial [bacterium]|nr:type 4a pilus biogenesis protein PilO [bacterium]